jgi:tetratricopeptide (TPR) repeat protein
MSEADYMVVLDTGSTDNTLKLLADNKKKYPNLIYAQKIIDPWRFDVARNENIKLIPEDANILFENDLDEWLEKGWSKPLREKWIEGKHQRGEYMYAWSTMENKQPARMFIYNKIHTRDWLWYAPVHEFLGRNGNPDYNNNEALDLTKDILLYHFPDPTKSRSSYTALLELRIKENPEDRIGHIYYAHDLAYNNKYEESNKEIDYIIEHFKINSKLEYSNLLLFKADNYVALKRTGDAIESYLNSIELYPTYREPYLGLAQLYLSLNLYKNAIYYVELALTNTVRLYNWMERDNTWSYLPYDILSLAYYYSGNKEKSLVYAVKAYLINDKNDRLKANVKVISDNI